MMCRNIQKKFLEEIIKHKGILCDDIPFIINYTKSRAWLCKDKCCMHDFCIAGDHFSEDNKLKQAKKVLAGIYAEELVI